MLISSVILAIVLVYLPSTIWQFVFVLSNYSCGESSQNLRLTGKAETVVICVTYAMGAVLCGLYMVGYVKHSTKALTAAKKEG